MLKLTESERRSVQCFRRRLRRPRLAQYWRLCRVFLMRTWMLTMVARDSRTWLLSRNLRWPIWTCRRCHFLVIFFHLYCFHWENSNCACKIATCIVLFNCAPYCVIKSNVVFSRATWAHGLVQPTAQTPAYTARPQILSQCITARTCLLPDFADAHLPVDVWLGRVDLAGWLYVEMVAHPSTDLPNIV